jgi:hypothetical protein
MKTIRALSLIEIILVLAIVTLLAAVAIPRRRHVSPDALRRACILNLKDIEGAKRRWAAGNKRAESDTPTDADLFGPARYIERKLDCPGGGTYSLNPIQAKPTCTIAGHAL